MICRLQYDLIDRLNTNISQFNNYFIKNMYISIPKRNIKVVMLFYLILSKSRAQYGSIDTSNINIRPVITIL